MYSPQGVDLRPAQTSTAASDAMKAPISGSVSAGRGCLLACRRFVRGI